MIQFDPTKHEGKQLYEYQTLVNTPNERASGWVAVDIPFEEAAMTPWYFIVEETDEELANKGKS